MKKLIIFTSLLISFQATVSAFSAPKTINCFDQSKADSLAEYTGKYQVVQKRGTVAIKIDLVDGELVCTQLWDGEKLVLRHLSGDSFMMAGFGWSVKFLRDKDKKITQILVMGTDRWDKVKE